MPNTVPADRGTAAPGAARSINNVIRRIGDLSARHPWRTIGSWAVLAALVVALSSTLGGTLVDDFSAPGSESAEAMELLEERFPEVAGGTGVAVFAAPEGERLDSHRAAIGAALSAVAGKEHVASLSDPFETGRISADGRIGYAELTLDVPASDIGAEAAAELVDAMEPARADGLVAELGGDAASFNREEEAGSEVVGILAALVVLVVAFGTVVAALVPIVIALVAVAAGLMGITVLAGALEVSTAAPVFGAMVGLGVGIDYALFIVSRYREKRAAGYRNAEALSAAMSSSGTAVVFAGITVVLAMTALVLTGIGILASIGLSTSLIVLFAVATAITLLPALLSLLGDRIDKGRVVGRRRKAVKPAEETASWRLAHRISARPWPYLVGASLVLLTLAAPALALKSSFPTAGDDARTSTQRKAYDLLTEGFGPGFNAPFVVVADLSGTDAADVTALADRLATVDGIAEVGKPSLSEDGTTAALTAIPTTEPADSATRQTLERVRDLTPAGVFVTGPTALTLDLDEQLAEALPVFIGAILVASVLLLMVVFRSIAVPLKAAAMNLLSIGGAYGVVVAVFQWGWLGGLFGLDGTFDVVSFFPTLFFAVLFGLSMDYEVFLVSRIREAYDQTGDNAEAVARGLAATGRVITSGALIMVCVFLSFVTNPDPFTKMIGVGLATAIFIDATIVRMVLVPATMALMGRANWWLPAWLDRVLPHLSLESDGPDAQAVVVPEPRHDVTVSTPQAEVRS